MTPIPRPTTMLLTLLMVFGLTAAASAQGVQTGTLRGKATDTQGLAVPGVLVTVSSPALQGERNTRTGGDGIFVFSALPPGDYTVRFDLAGFTTENLVKPVPLGAPVEVEVTLRAAAVTEQIRVIADRPDDSPSVGLNIRQPEVEALPLGRDITSIATLSPGVTENSANAGQIVISGAFAYDNLFMVNGVDINDNLFGDAQSLFIEDAIAETQVLTSGIGAEFGRFSGGVINAITKSGGNNTAGSYRLNLTNPAWTAETPFEQDNDIEFDGKLNTSHEGTFGGPIIRDRLWYFFAGRAQSITTGDSFDVTGLEFDTKRVNRRAEIKLTGTVSPGHTVQGGYLNNFTENTNRLPLGFSIDPFTLVSDKNPNWYTFANYRGLLTDTLLAEAHYTERRFEFQDFGGTATDLVDSPIIDFFQGNFHYNAPFFDASDPEQRNNRQFSASVTKFVQSRGRHEIKGGYEFYRSQLTGGNSQSSTGFTFYAPLLFDDDGNTVFDDEGHLVPMWIPGLSELDVVLAERGARLNTDTQSFYIQDHWMINPNLSADVGFRYERARSEATGGLIGVDTDTVVPRLALAYDLEADGRTVISVTYGHYAGRYNEALLSANSPVGNPTRLFGIYCPVLTAEGCDGPAGVGRDFAEGFNPDNYVIYSGAFPSQNVVFEDGLSSPIVKEFTLGASRVFGSRAIGSLTYVRRTTTNLIEDFVDQDSGSSLIEIDGSTFGPFTNRVYRNTDLGERNYQALVFEGRYTIQPNWTVNGAWTVQLKNEGNFEGEATNQPAIPTVIADFPETLSEARHFPTGRLANFQRHRGRIWTIYNHSLGRAGDVSLSGLLRVESGLSYSLSATVPAVSDQQFNALFPYPEGSDPFFLFGYSQTLFFDERGSESFKGFAALDASVNYTVPFWRQFQPYVKFDVFNLFNNQKQIAFDNTIDADFDGPVDDLGLPTTFIEGPNFGEATSAAHFPDARAFRMAFGIRF